MGLAKRDLIRADEIGWKQSYDDKNVCVSCIEDPALQEVVKENLESKICSYCGKQRKELIAAPLDAVTEHMAECIAQVYTDVDVLPYDKEEHCYYGTVYETHELLEEIGFSVENEDLFNDICSSFVRKEWAKENWMILTPDQRKFYGWDAFKRAVKHKRRYTFWSMGDEDEQEGHPDYMPVSNVLVEISGVIRDTGLIKPIKKGKRIWRVRTHSKHEILNKETDFTSPPVEAAKKPNRMSPAGVPMFYGAEDFNTAYLETFNPKKDKCKVVTGGYFKTLKELRILDLVDIPSITSFFDKKKTNLRNNLLFLSRFVEDIAESINDCQDIEYVPTQAFTEYIRWMIKTSDGKTVDGIKYRSAINKGICYVLFCEQDDCIDKPEDKLHRQVLQFEYDSLKTYDPDKASTTTGN